MSVTIDAELTGLNLTDDWYRVQQNLVRNRYTATNSRGEVVLRASQKLFKLKEEFPFVDGNGNPVFTVKAGSVFDVAGNYVVVDERTGEDVLILDNDYSFFQDTWKIRDARTEAKIAEINSRGALVTITRNVLPFGQLLPHKYTITDLEGNWVGRIDGQFSLKDTYDIAVNATNTDVPVEPILAAAMVIDAIQGN